MSLIGIESAEHQRKYRLYRSDNTTLREQISTLTLALRGLMDAAHHDCGGSEKEHLLEHLGPASMRALEALDVQPGAAGSKR